MKIKREFEKTREDGGGIITLGSEDPDGMLYLMKHFSQDNASTIQEAMKAGKFSAQLGNRSKERPAYVVDVELPDEFLRPYRQEFKKRTGASSLPDLELTELFGNYRNLGIFHTHVIMASELKSGKLTALIGVESEDWMGKPADVRAVNTAREYLLEDFGNRQPVPEYIHLSNGLFRPNPDYPHKRNPVNPSVSAKWFFIALCDYWLENEASEEQKEWAEADRQLMQKNHKGIGTLRDINSYDKGLRKSWEGDMLSWEDFKAMRG